MSKENTIHFLPTLSDENIVWESHHVEFSITLTIKGNRVVRIDYEFLDEKSYETFFSNFGNFVLVLRDEKNGDRTITKSGYIEEITGKVLP